MPQLVLILKMNVLCLDPALPVSRVEWRNTNMNTIKIYIELIFKKILIIEIPPEQFKLTSKKLTSCLIRWVF